MDKNAHMFLAKSVSYSGNSLVISHWNFQPTQIRKLCDKYDTRSNKILFRNKDVGSLANITPHYDYFIQVHAAPVT